MLNKINKVELIKKKLSFFKFGLVFIFFICILILFSFIQSNKIIIVDMAKNTVKIPVNIERVVTLDPFSTQIMIGLGLSNLLIDAQHGKNLVGEGFLKAVPNYNDWGSSFSGNTVILEKLIEKKPDLIISQVGRPDINKILELKIPVIQLEVENDQAFIGALNLCGEIFNKKTKAAEISRYISKNLNNFYLLNDKNKNAKKPKIYFAGSKLFRTFGNQSFQYWLANISGGIIVTEKYNNVKVDINPETLIKLNPDYIFLAKYTSDNIESILNDPRFTVVNAIKNKSVYRIPTYIISWDLPSFEMISGISFLRYLFNFLSITDFYSSLKELYKVCYNIEITDSEIENLLICK